MRFREVLALLGGVAAIGCVTAAVAADKAHVMIVRLPDGSVEHVRYTGDTPPRILIADPSARPVAMVPMAGFNPFAEMDRIAAMMDAQTDAMMAHASEMQRVAMTQAASTPAGQATVVNLPQGAGSFSYVSTTTVNGKTCTVSMTSQPGQQQGAQPQMLRKVSGDGCSAVQQPTGPHLAAQPATPTPPAAPHAVSMPVAPKAPVAKTVAPDTI